MGVQFSISGHRYDVVDPSTYVDMSNVNGRELLQLLDVHEESLMGGMRAREMKERCTAALKLLKERGDPGIEGHSEGNYHFGGRSPGLLSRRLGELIDLCEKAGELGLITWG